MRTEYAAVIVTDASGRPMITRKQRAVILDIPWHWYSPPDQPSPS